MRGASPLSLAPVARHQRPPALRASPGIFRAQRRTCAALLIALGACAPAPPTTAPLDLPPEVLAAVPADLDLSEVNRDPDGCYFYTYAASLFVVRDRDGEPICLP